MIKYSCKKVPSLVMEKRTYLSESSDKFSELPDKQASRSDVPPERSRAGEEIAREVGRNEKQCAGKALQGFASCAGEEFASPSRLPRGDTPP